MKYTKLLLFVLMKERMVEYGYFYQEDHEDQHCDGCD